MATSEVTWLIVGLVLGTVAGAVAYWWLQMERARRARHPMEVPFKMPPRTAVRDWQIAELTPRLPEPKKSAAPIAPVLQECPQCGLAFKRVAQHIRMKHERAVAS